MLEVYLDESISYFGPDSKRQPLLVMGGYVAEQAEWSSFSAEWSEVLKAFELTHFHAKRLRSGDDRLYRHLSFNQRRQLLSRLCTLISTHVISGIAAYMRPDDYEEGTTGEFRSKIGSSYGTLVDIILINLSQVLTNPEGEPERVSIFLESGHKNDQEALAQIDKYKQATEPVPDSVEGVAPCTVVRDPLRTHFMRIGKFGLVGKTDAAPAQAADLLVYLIGAAAHIEDTAPIFEGTLDRLLESRPHVLSPWSPEAVKEYVDVAMEADQAAARIRGEVYQTKRHLRSFGLKVEEKPWGITVDGRHLSEDEWQAFVVRQKN